MKFDFRKIQLFEWGELYYAELPSAVSRMIFDRHTAYRRLLLNPGNDKQNLYNISVNVLVP